MPFVWGFLDASPVFALRIQVPGLGTLVLNDSTNIIAVFQRGNELVAPEPIDGTSWRRLLQRVLGDAPFPERLTLAGRLQEVAFAMHFQGHGGTLVIAPPFEPPEDTVGVTMKYRFDPKGVDCIREAIGEWTEAHRRLEAAKAQPPAGGDGALVISLLQSSVDACGKQVSRILRSIGELSRIDGAVVMDTDLGVHGFGAKLSGTEGSFDVAVVDVITWLRSKVSLGELGGMRHQSAARYVHQNTHSLVVVASQDGRLTLFVGDIAGARVCVLRGLEHYTWGAREY